MRPKILTVMFAALILAGSVAGIVVPAGLGWDFANFYDAGRRVLAGQIADLYAPTRPIAGAPPQGTLGFFGAPLSALLYAPLGMLPPERALIAFKIQNVLAFAGAFVVLFRFYRPFRPPGTEATWQFAALFAGLCLLFQPFWTVFRVGGQTTPTVLLLAAIALVAHVSGRFWTSAACFIAAALIKPALAPAVGLLTCVSGWPFFWRGVTAGIATAVVSIALLGLPVHLDFVRLMLASGRLTYPWFYNSSLFILIDNVRMGLDASGGSGHGTVLIAWLETALQAGALALIAALLVGVRRQSWPAAAQRHFLVILALLLFVLASRTVWEHYLALLFPLAVYVVAARRHFSAAATRLIWTIAALLVFQNLIFTNWLRPHIDPAALLPLVGVALYKSGPLLLTVALLLRHRRELFASHGDPVWAGR